MCFSIRVAESYSSGVKGGRRGYIRVNGILGVRIAAWSVGALLCTGCIIECRGGYD